MKRGGVALRRSTAADLAYVTALERRADHVDIIGQWSDAEHLAAIARAEGREHWIMELGGRPAGYLIAYDGRAWYPGVYIKRVLVADKDRGTGRAALAAFLDLVFARAGVDFAWLNVRNGNERAQALYRALGFEPYRPGPEASGRLAHAGEIPNDNAFSMRLERVRWPR